MSVNCSAQEQLLVPGCQDRSQKHRETPSQVGWQPMVIRAGACQIPVCHQVSMAVLSKMSSSAVGDAAQRKAFLDGEHPLHAGLWETTCPRGCASWESFLCSEAVELLQAVQTHFCLQPPHDLKRLSASEGFSVPPHSSAPLLWQVPEAAA